MNDDDATNNVDRRTPVFLEFGTLTDLSVLRLQDLTQGRQQDPYSL